MKCLPVPGEKKTQKNLDPANVIYQEDFDLAGYSRHLPPSPSRVSLLVRMGLIRARLDSSRGEGRDGDGLRPVAEQLWREVEELRGSSLGGGLR